MKRRHWDRPARVEMMPFIDVIFLLLVVFIYSMTTMVRSYVVPVELPALASGEFRDLSHVAVVTVEEDGALSLDRVKLPLDALVVSLRERAAADPDLKILLNASADARHGRVAAVLDRLRSADLAQVFLVAEEARSATD